MKFTVKEKFLLGKAEDKGSVMLYTLLSLPNFDKVVAIGNKIEGLKERETVYVTLDITTKSERLQIKGEDSARFIETARIYVSDVEKTGE